MITKEFRYHIYNKNECVYHSLEEKQFKVIWGMPDSMVGPNTRPSKQDLSYEKVEFVKEISLDSSH